MLLFVVILTLLTAIFAQQVLDGSGECGLSGLYGTNIEARVAGGRPAKAGELPWQVRLEFNGQLCGGSILTPNWIITAAHCTFSFRKRGGVAVLPEDVRVFVGVLTMSEQDDPREIDRIVRHPDYTAGSSFDSDFALIHLKDSLEWNSNIRPICLPLNCTDDVPPGTICLVSGWGKSDYEDMEPQETLQVGRIPIKSSESCQASMASKPEPEVNTLQITSRMVCAGVDDAHVDSCSGDSGGPLSCRNSKIGSRFTLSGITSFGYMCAQPGYFGVYARPCIITSWIRSIVLPVTTTTTIKSTTTTTTSSTTTTKRPPTTAAMITTARPVDLAISYARLVITGPSSTKVCAGTFVSSQWVLTAASCFPFKSTIIAYIGRTAAGKPQFSISAIRVVLHPNYEPDFLDYNVALVKLGVPVGKGIVPITLLGGADCRNNAFTTMRDCMAMGMGSISTGRWSSSADVQKATVSALTDAKCRSILQEDDFGYTAAKKCFGNANGQQANEECRAVDIGSPVLCKDTSNNRYTLQGVMSYALAGSCSATMPSFLVCTNKCVITDWIQETISQ